MLPFPLLVLALAHIVNACPQESKLSEELPASEAPEALAKAFQNGAIRKQFIDMTGTTPRSFELASFARELGNQGLYFAKVKTGDEEYAHLRIARIMRPRLLRLQGVRLGKTLTDGITYFEPDNSDTQLPYEPTDIPIIPEPEPEPEEPEFEPELDEPDYGGEEEVPTDETQIDPLYEGDMFESGRVITTAGGWSETYPALSAPQGVTSAMQTNGVLSNQFTTRTGVRPKQFSLIVFRKQLVNGFNYLAKVKIDANSYAHLLFSQPFLNPVANTILRGVRLGVSIHDPLNPFTPDSTWKTN